MGLTKKMTQNQRLEVALARLEERVEALQQDIKEMQFDVKKLNITAERWKGGFWIMMGLGGILGVIINFGIGWFR